MSSDEINQDQNAQDEKNKELLLEIFYKTKGNIDDINAAIDKKLFGKQKRSITIFEKYIRARLTLNPKVLNLAGQEITPIEAAYSVSYTHLTLPTIYSV